MLIVKEQRSLGRDWLIGRSFVESDNLSRRDINENGCAIQVEKIAE